VPYVHKGDGCLRRVLVVPTNECTWCGTWASYPYSCLLLAYLAFDVSVEADQVVAMLAQTKKQDMVLNCVRANGLRSLLVLENHVLFGKRNPFQQRAM
jgi:hypothetical protein